MSTQLTWGAPQPERADAARNRQLLLATARELLQDGGADCLTMDRLAERSGLGKGTVFRRFGTRAGIFQALLDDSERDLQQAILTGPPPLGPGAPPVDRLVAYGRARIRFLAEHHAVAGAALDVRRGPRGHPPTSRTHIRVLLRELALTGADLDALASQLAAALDVPLVLHLSAGPTEQTGPADPTATARFERAWCYLVERLCRPAPGAQDLPDDAAPRPERYS